MVWRISTTLALLVSQSAMNSLRKYVPGHDEGSDKVVPLNVSIRGWPTMQKIPPKVINELLFGLADFVSRREHNEIRS